MYVSIGGQLSIISVITQVFLWSIVHSVFSGGSRASIKGRAESMASARSASL